MKTDDGTTRGHTAAYAALAVVLLVAAAPAVSGALAEPTDAGANASALGDTGPSASAATQSTPTVAVGNVTVDVNESGTAALSLSSAPNGLSGFTIVISVGSTATATITNGSANNSFGLTNVTVADDGSSVRIKAVDLDNSTTAGATDIPLGSVEVTGVSGGETNLTVTIERLDDDDGNPISAATDDGVASVQAASFEVSDLSVSPTSGTAPLNVTANATVTNVGNDSGTTMVPLVVDGVTVEEVMVSLAPGASTTVEFTTSLDAGNHTVGIGDANPVTVDVSSSDGGGGDTTTTTTTTTEGDGGGDTTTSTTTTSTTTTSTTTTSTSTTSTSTTSTSTTTIPPVTTVATTTTTTNPGFGAVVAALAVLLAGLLALRPE